MPICKVYHSGPLDISEKTLEEIENIILTELEAAGENAEVIFTPASAINHGTIYIEILCRNKKNRTPEMLLDLAKKLDGFIKGAIGVVSVFKTRIITIDEDHLSGTN